MKSAFRSVDLLRPALIVLGAGVALSAAAVHTEGSEKTPTIVSGDAVTWGSAPPSLPPGAQATVLLGSPAKEGPFVLRLKFPAGFVVPPHRHSKDELVTVISGRFSIVGGETVDRAAFRPLGGGKLRPHPCGYAALRDRGDRIGGADQRRRSVRRRVPESEGRSQVTVTRCADNAPRGDADSTLSLRRANAAPVDPTAGVASPLWPLPLRSKRVEPGDLGFTPGEPPPGTIGRDDVTVYNI